MLQIYALFHLLFFSSDLRQIFSYRSSLFHLSYADTRYILRYERGFLVALKHTDRLLFLFPLFSLLFDQHAGLRSHSIVLNLVFHADFMLNI